MQRLYLVLILLVMNIQGTVDTPKYFNVPVSFEPLVDAIKHDQLNKVQELLKNSLSGATDEELGAFLSAALKGTYTDKVKAEPVMIEIINHMKTITVEQLFYAAQFGFFKVIDAMLPKLIDKDTALTMVLQENLPYNRSDKDYPTQMAHYLIDHGARVTMEAFSRVLMSGTEDLSLIKKMRSKIRDIDDTDNRGMPALIAAFEGGNIDTIKYLLDEGATPNTTVEGIPLLATLIFFYYSIPVDIEKYAQNGPESPETIRKMVNLAYAVIEELLKRGAWIDTTVQKIASGDIAVMEEVLKGTHMVGGPNAKLNKVDSGKINQIKVLLQKYAKK